MTKQNNNNSSNTYESSNILVMVATVRDCAAILDLQKVAYQTEAERYQDWNLPPLRQSLDDIQAEHTRSRFLKAVIDERIIGSVRAYEHEGSCYVGRLIVHPDYRHRGLGTRLLLEIENCFPNARRFELFTGSQSADNLRLYTRLGYREFKRDFLHPRIELVFLEKFRLSKVHEADSSHGPNFIDH